MLPRRGNAQQQFCYPKCDRPLPTLRPQVIPQDTGQPGQQRYPSSYIPQTRSTRRPRVQPSSNHFSPRRNPRGRLPQRLGLHEKPSHRQQNRRTQSPNPSSSPQHPRRIRPRLHQIGMWGF